MPKPYSEDLRKRVIDKTNEGKTVEQIMGELDIKETFVYAMRKLHKDTGSIAPKKPSGGRPPSISATQLAQIKTLVLETPDITLAEIKERLSLVASISRICDAINYKLNLPLKKRHSLIQVKTEKM